MLSIPLSHLLSNPLSSVLRLPYRPLPSVPPTRPPRLLRTALLTCLFTLLLCSAPARADDEPAPAGTAIAVLFPDVGAPYRKVFLEIIAGVEQQAPGKVSAIALAPGMNGAELRARLKRGGSRSVIALGREGMKVAATLDGSLQVVVGGIGALPEPEQWRGISLMPDPALLFSWLKALVPGVRRVLVVHHPVQSAMAVRLAREAARMHGLELVTFEAQDLASAVRRYEALFAVADGRRDALWLPQDAVTVDESTILPLVLRESWHRHLPVFSTSMLHVKRGVLFALYPDNIALGRELAVMAQAPAAVPATPPAPPAGLQPLRTVRMAFNTRTAGHLGLDVDTVRHPFDAIFP